MIGIIDYKAGNAPSVHNAFEKLGIKSEITGTTEGIKSSSAIVLPGVGSAEATMESLYALECFELIKFRVLEEKIPFLGICIGQQVLFDYSEEGNVKCLGWISGTVRRFSHKDLIRVPQMGWNEAVFTREDKILKGLKKSEYFYFVNSYYVEPDDKSVILAKTEYGTNFCSMVNYKNIYATQFHAEKSGEMGLLILKNFAEGACIC